MIENKIVPVVFASSDNYAPYLGVALYSLIAHSNPKQKYHIYLLFTDISLEHQKRFKQMEQDNITIFCMDIKDYTENIHNFKGPNRLSVETTYRLVIADLLPQYDKVLYLDADIIILDDIAKLYSFDLGESILGVGEIDPFEDWKKYVQENLKIPTHHTFNAGILLINTKLFSAYKVKEKALALLADDWNAETPLLRNQDQDALTLICKNQVARFPQEWNLEWQREFKKSKSETPSSKEEEIRYQKARENVKIIHYASGFKPWNSPELPLADIFWKYARNTLFYQEILLKEAKKEIEEVKEFYRPFPWDEIASGSSIVIYGAGLLGQSYLRQISAASYCFVAAVCDQNIKKIHNLVGPLVSKEELLSLEFDSLLIAVENKDVASTIRQDLIALGVPEEKIKWNVRQG